MAPAGRRPGEVRGEYQEAVEHYEPRPSSAARVGGTFRPGVAVTREQVAVVMIARYWRKS